MANVKQGQTVRPPQPWKHLRDWKQLFWHRQRCDDQRIARADITEMTEVACSVSELLWNDD